MPGRSTVRPKSSRTTRSEATISSSSSSMRVAIGRSLPSFIFRPAKWWLRREIVSAKRAKVSANNRSLCGVIPQLPNNKGPSGGALKNGCAALLFFLFAPAFAQDTCNYATNETDEFTGAVKVATKMVEVGNGGHRLNELHFRAGRVDKEHWLEFFMYGSSGCSSSGSYAIVKFTDGSTVRLENFGKVNCKAPSIRARYDPLAFDGKTVEKVRLGYTEGYHDCEVTKPDVIAKALECTR